MLVPQRLYRYLVGPARFELATSTMSRLIELATTRQDTLKFNWSGSDTPVLHYKTHVSSRYHLHHVTRQRNSSRYVAYVCLGASGPVEELNQAIREQVARLRTNQVLH